VSRWWEFSLGLSEAPLEIHAIPAALSRSSKERQQIRDHLAYLDDAPPREALAAWGRALGDAVEGLRAGAGIAICAGPDDLAVHTLPWELLVAPGERLPLSLSEGGAVLRVVEAVALRAPSEAPGGSIVFGWSAAGGRVPHAKHRTALEMARGERSEIHIEEVPDATLKGLGAVCRRLRGEGRPARVLHLLAHGDQSGGASRLRLGSERRPRVVAPLELEHFLGSLEGLSLLSLHVCSGGLMGGPDSLLAAAARSGVGPVIGSEYPLSALGSEDAVAHLFTALLDPDGGAILPALRAARCLLHLQPSASARVEKAHDWASLSLYLPALPEVAAGAGDGDPYFAQRHLDRAQQWKRVRDACQKRESAILLLHGDRKQALYTFLERVWGGLEVERPHRRVNLKILQNMGLPATSEGWEECLMSELPRGAGGLPGRLRAAAREKPIFLLLGGSALDVEALEEFEREALQSFLVERFLPALRAAAPRCPVRLLLALEYPPPAPASIFRRLFRGGGATPAPGQSWVEALYFALCEASPEGCEVSMLPQAESVTWGDIQDYVRNVLHQEPTPAGWARLREAWERSGGRQARFDEVIKLLS